MSEPITFLLDGESVTAAPGETIWQVANRLGTEIPHLCWQPYPGYRADGNCRACMVEIEGERTLAASCIRPAMPGMVVKSASSERVRNAREGVMELLLAVNRRGNTVLLVTHEQRYADLCGRKIEISDGRI